MSIEWVYDNGYSPVCCYAKTDVGFYTIYQDDDRMGFPLCLEFHQEKEGWCRKGSLDIPVEQCDTLSEIQEVAENHYKSETK